VHAGSGGAEAGSADYEDVKKEGDKKDDEKK